MQPRNLLRQMIESVMEKYQNYSIKKNYIRAFWEFYSAFNLSYSVLKFYNQIEIKKRDIRIRNKLFKKILEKGKLDEKDFQKVNKHINKDREVITNAIDFLDKLGERNENIVLETDREDYIAVLASEVQEL